MYIVVKIVVFIRKKASVIIDYVFHFYNLLGFDLSITLVQILFIRMFFVKL